MDTESVQKIINSTRKVRSTASFALLMLAIFLLVATVSSLKSMSYIGQGVAPTNTITVSGEGEVYAVPNTATFTFSVSETAKDVATAQSKATDDINKAIAYLKSQGIADEDIQTTDYSISPQYTYQQAVCPAVAVNEGTVSSAVYCPSGKQTLTGYQVSETDTIKVRDTDKAGTLLSGLGSAGISNVSGLSFTNDNQNDLQDQARTKAITEAKKKAQELAHELGVSLGTVTSFNENTGGVVPIMYAAKAMSASADSIAPSISTGQNKITSDVTITYAIY